MHYSNYCVMVYDLTGPMGDFGPSDVSGNHKNRTRALFTSFTPQPRFVDITRLGMIELLNQVQCYPVSLT